MAPSLKRRIDLYTGLYKPIIRNRVNEEDDVKELLIRNRVEACAETLDINYSRIIGFSNSIQLYFVLFSSPGIDLNERFVYTAITRGTVLNFVEN